MGNSAGWKTQVCVQMFGHFPMCPNMKWANRTASDFVRVRGGSLPTSLLGYFVQKWAKILKFSILILHKFKLKNVRFYPPNTHSGGTFECRIQFHTWWQGQNFKKEPFYGKFCRLEHSSVCSNVWTFPNGSIYSSQHKFKIRFGSGITFYIWQQCHKIKKVTIFGKLDFFPSSWDFSCWLNLLNQAEFWGHIWMRNDILHVTQCHNLRKGNVFGQTCFSTLYCNFVQVTGTV